MATCNDVVFIVLIRKRRITKMISIVYYYNILQLTCIACVLCIILYIVHVTLVKKYETLQIRLRMERENRLERIYSKLILFILGLV